MGDRPQGGRGTEEGGREGGGSGKSPDLRRRRSLALKGTMEEAGANAQTQGLQM